MRLLIHVFTVLLVLSTACATRSERTSLDDSDTLVIEAPNIQLDTLTVPRRSFTEEKATAGDIAFTADIALKPMVDALVANFMATHTRATLRPIYLPAEEAIATMLASDTIRLAIATRKLTGEETNILGDQLIIPDYAMVARDAVVLVTHPENPDTSLSESQLREMLTGKITKWVQINPNSPLNDVTLVLDHQQSGARRFLQDSLLNGKNLKSERLFALQSAEEVVEYVATHKGAVGILGWAQLADKDDPSVQNLKSKIKIVFVDGMRSPDLCPYKPDFFGPYQSFLTTQCYLLGRDVYTIRREAIFGLGTGFISYMAGYKGQRIIHKLGLGAIKGIPREVKLPPKTDARNPKTGELIKE
ncbi:MAG: substrate-binding domain-containing protein [Bacteroidota bacterium]